ncbi:MAG: hypothetical protein IJ796_10280 [Lachnospiraceae bacterium]|nr:hypothetical protein [Lachnospiraceae bacterium]
MKKSGFLKILVCIAVLGMLITVAHAVYIYHAYNYSSIIQFVAREMWW